LHFAKSLDVWAWLVEQMSEERTEKDFSAM